MHGQKIIRAEQACAVDCTEEINMIRYRIKGITYASDEKSGATVVCDENGEVITNSGNTIEAFNTFWQEAGQRVLNELKEKIEVDAFGRLIRGNLK